MALGKVLYQSAAPRDVFTAPVLRAHRAALGQARLSLFMALGKVLPQGMSWVCPHPTACKAMMPKLIYGTG